MFKYVKELEDRPGEAARDGINFHNYMEEYYDVVGDEPTPSDAVTLAKELFDEYEQTKYKEWIRKWHDWNVWLYEEWGPDDWKPVATEQWIEVEIEDGLPTKYWDAEHWEGDVHHGYIDAIWWDPEKEQYGVVDYKSKAKTGSNIKGQTAYYAEVLLALDDLLDETPQWAGCYGYKTGTFKRWDIHWKSIKASAKKIERLKSMSKDYDPNYGYHCDWCPYKEECILMGDEDDNVSLLDI